MDVIEKFQVLINNKEKAKFPSFLQTMIKKKFCDFNVYQLGKYCSEGKRKRQLLQFSKKKKLTMKAVVRACHIKRPAFLVASIIGKKYPMTSEAYAESSFSAEGDFKPELAGKRMKIPTPATWETTLSEKGNKAECWEKLIKTNKLPFMAMLRNVRNLLITGVDEDTHNMVSEKLRNPDIIQRSRLFPFRFLSAFESLTVDLEELEKIKNDPNYVPAIPSGKRSLKFSRRGASSQSPKYKPKVKIPKIIPTQDTINRYKDALEEAIKLATALNVSPIRGHTVIFCDASGSMQCKISSGEMGSVRTCMDLGYLFGVMLRHVCESCDVYLLSSPQPPETPKCWRKVELEGDNIFNLLNQVKAVSDEMGRSNEYPYD